MTIIVISCFLLLSSPVSHSIFPLHFLSTLAGHRSLPGTEPQDLFLKGLGLYQSCLNWVVVVFTDVFTMGHGDAERSPRDGLYPRHPAASSLWRSSQFPGSQDQLSLPALALQVDSESAGVQNAWAARVTFNSMESFFSFLVEPFVPLELTLLYQSIRSWEHKLKIQQLGHWGNSEKCHFYFYPSIPRLVKPGYKTTGTMHCMPVVAYSAS